MIEHRTPDVVTRRCEATLHLDDRDVDGVTVTLVGGRHRYRVGGAIAEGFRWWRGRLEDVDAVVDLRDGAEIGLEVEGRRVAAVVEAEPGAELSFRGIGPPPFDVDHPPA